MIDCGNQEKKPYNFVNLVLGTYIWHLIFSTQKLNVYETY